MRKLSDLELEQLEFLSSKGIEVALIEPTATGLSKSILDATLTVREFLSRHKVHEYKTQPQGPENKVVYPAVLITDKDRLAAHASLYRPKTKTGDPRIWFTGLQKFARPNDILAIAYLDKKLWLVNITTMDLPLLFAADTPLKDFISQLSKEEFEAAAELLGKIRLVAAKGFIPSDVTADTAVGRLLETELGIKINSSAQPDYKGIELKSFRSARQNRKNLFAQVPDWQISKLKSSAEILDAFGYERENIKKLYCTVSTLKPNPQGLILYVQNEAGLLHEKSVKLPTTDVVAWKLEKLHERLLEKHTETFWVEADSKIVSGVEHLKFTKIEHTRGPLLPQFDTLLNEGRITLDHLIKRQNGRVSEKGPIFKLDQRALNILFPPSKVYTL